MLRLHLVGTTLIMCLVACKGDEPAADLPPSAMAPPDSDAAPEPPSPPHADPATTAGPAPSPYQVGNSRGSTLLVPGCIPTDPSWKLNEVSAELVGLGARRRALGLRVYYATGEVLTLTGSEIVEPSGGSAPDHRVCLTEPAPRDGTCDAKRLVAVQGQPGVPVDAAEWTFFMNDTKAARGTVIVAPKIVVAGDVTTLGHDLVLVALEIEFRPGGKISTTPKTRPSGALDGYEYGYGGEGYPPGDVVLVASRVTGPATIQANGGASQRGKSGWPVSRMSHVGTLQAAWGGGCAAYVKGDPGNPEGEIPAPLCETIVYSAFDASRPMAGSAGGEVTVLTRETCVELVSETAGGPGGAGAASEAVPLSETVVYENEPLSWTPEGTRVGADGQSPRARLHASGELMWHPSPGLDRQGGRCPDFAPRDPKCLTKEHAQEPECAFEHAHDLACDPWTIPTTASGHLDLQRACGHMHCQLDDARAPESDDPFEDLCPDDVGGRDCRFHHCAVLGRAFGFREPGTCLPGAPDAPQDCAHSIGTASFYLVARPGRPGPPGRTSVLSFSGAPWIDGVATARDPATPPYRAEPPLECRTDGGLTLEEVNEYYVAHYAPLWPALLLHNADSHYRRVAHEAPSDDPMRAGATYFYAALRAWCVADDERMWDWPECRIAEVRLDAITDGIPFSGIAEEFLPRDPRAIGGYVDLMANRYEQARQSLDQVASRLVTVENGSVAGLVEESMLESALKDANREVELAEAVAKTQAEAMDLALKRLQAAETEMTETKGPDIFGGKCPQCAYTEVCATPSVSVEIGLVTKCAEPPPCDFLCWLQRVFGVLSKIADLASAIYSMNPKAILDNLSSTFATLEEAFKALQTVNGFIEGLKTIGQYAKLLVTGSSGSVTYRADVLPKVTQAPDGSWIGLVKKDGRWVEVEETPTGTVYGREFPLGTELKMQDGAVVAQVPVPESIRKTVIDPTINVVQKARELADGIAALVTPAPNPFAARMEALRKAAADSRAQLQRNLTDVYGMQAQAATNAPVLPHLRSLEDLIKHNQALLEKVDVARRDHVLASGQMIVADTRLRTARARVLDLTRELERAKSLLTQERHQTSDFELAVHAACRRTEAELDRTQLLLDLYQAAMRHLWPATAPKPSGLAPTFTEASLSAVHEALAQASIDDFIAQVLQPQGPAAVVQEVITAPQWLAQVGPNGPVFTRRTASEIAAALCVGGGEVCPLSKTAYFGELLTSFVVGGIMRFEIVPEHDVRYQQLPEATRQAWNPTWSVLATRPRAARVFDASARVLMEPDFVMPSSISVPITLRHRGDLHLRSATEDRRLTVLGTSIEHACKVASAFGSGTITCAPVGAPYERTLVGTLGYEATQVVLDGQSFSEASRRGFFGASALGHWELDMTTFFAAVRTYDDAFPNQSICDDGQPCSLAQHFRENLQGIQMRFYMFENP